MKTMIAATLMLFATAATADWEDIFQNPDLTSNYQGHTTVASVSYDPVAETYANNSDLFAGDKSGDVRNMDSNPTSLDVLGSKNPDMDCGCI
ncbi:MAG: hypothetical protein ABFR19_08980 [Pseudomonadota bacterium]